MKHIPNGYNVYGDEITDHIPNDVTFEWNGNGTIIFNWPSGPHGAATKYFLYLRKMIELYFIGWWFMFLVGLLLNEFSSK